MINQRKSGANILLILPMVILFVGLFFLYSASWREGLSLDQNLALRQIIWIALAFAAMALALKVHYERLSEIIWPLYGLTMILLVVVFFVPARLGAHRWLDLGFFNLQPSELAKLSIILALAFYLKEERFQTAGIKEKLMPFFIVAVPVILIAQEPDLGTALLFVPTFFAMIHVWGFRTRWIASIVAGFCIASPILYTFLKDYQKNRLLTFFNPDRDPLGAGYTIIQSKIAVGSGGLMGKGFLAGTQSHLEFLPERHTDFIFSVIGEEGGFIAAGIVILCYWAMIVRGFAIAIRCHNRFGRYLALGITTMLAFQALINMGMTMGLFPVVGMPLFLMSYGGSSLVVSMFMIGILINISNDT